MQKLRKGDKVLVLLGKDRGKEGVIEKLDMKKGRVWLPGLNVFKRHVKKNAQYNIEGGIVDVSKPLKISNIELICPSCKKPTRVGFEIKKDGKVRVCRKCKKEIA